MKLYLLNDAGETIGPFEEADVLHMWIETGEVNGDTLGCKEGEEQWNPLKLTLNAPRPQNATPTRRESKPGKPVNPICQGCGAPMRKTLTSKGFSSLIVDLLIFAVGVAVIYFLPPIGYFLGPVICLAAIFRSNTRKIWKCDRCGFTMDRI